MCAGANVPYTEAIEKYMRVKSNLADDHSTAASALRTACMLNMAGGVLSTCTPPTLSLPLLLSAWRACMSIHHEYESCVF